MNTSIARYHSANAPSLLGRTVFDDIFNTFFSDVPTYVKASTQGYPVADIYSDSDGNTVMQFALAGFSKEELTVEVKPEDRSIMVAASSDDETSGERRIARRAFKKTYVNYDDNLDLASAQASYENGLLSIVVPRRPETQPLTINID
jgi:HSP20 family molecular chaperone IbpA